MLYDLNNPLHRENFKARCNHLFKKRGVVELTDKRKRSLNSNNYLHLILSYFGCETGNSLEYVKENYYKKLVNPEIFIKEKNDPYLGDVEILRSSADLSVEEMSVSIDRFRNWASLEAGIFLPDAANEEALLQMQLEVERNKRFL